MKIAAYLLIILICSSFNFSVNKKAVVIGYVGGYRGLVNTSAIEVERLTHINYAFVDIKDNKAWLHQERIDTVNFRNLNQLRNRNRDIKILISIGGWSWSGKFSDAVRSDTGRTIFAKSATSDVTCVCPTQIVSKLGMPNAKTAKTKLASRRFLMECRPCSI